MTTPDAFACEGMNCKLLLTDPLETCEKRHCSFARQRRREEDRARREEEDRRGQEGIR